MKEIRVPLLLVFQKLNPPYHMVLKSSHILDFFSKQRESRIQNFIGNKYPQNLFNALMYLINRLVSHPSFNLCMVF